MPAKRYKVSLLPEERAYLHQFTRLGKPRPTSGRTPRFCYKPTRVTAAWGGRTSTFVTPCTLAG